MSAAKYRWIFGLSLALLIAGISAWADGPRPIMVDAASPARDPAVFKGPIDDDVSPRMAARLRNAMQPQKPGDGKPSEEWSTALSPGQPRPPAATNRNNAARLSENASSKGVKRDPPQENATEITETDEKSADAPAKDASEPKSKAGSDNKMDFGPPAKANPSPGQRSVLHRGNPSNSSTEDDLTGVFENTTPADADVAEASKNETPTPATPESKSKVVSELESKTPKKEFAREQIRVAELPDKTVPKENADSDLEVTTHPPVQLGKDLVQLRNYVRRALAVYSQKPLNARDHSPWEVFHAVLGSGTDAQLLRYPAGPAVNAVGYMCYNYPCRGERLFYLDDHQQMVVRKGPGLQGHYGQFLAVLAQTHVREDYPLLIGDKHFTVKDLIEHEQKDCAVGEELTFKLIGLAHYLPADATWTSQDGQEWTVARLLGEEIKQPINGAACGGTHRLMGLGYALHMRQEQGGAIDGEYERARNYLREYHHYTFSMQNQDGSFSTEWFRRKGQNPDVERRLKTTGHVVEWLTFTLPDNEVTKPAMQKSVYFLAWLMLNNENKAWENGPRGHAMRALRLYDERVFQPADEPTLAKRPEKVARRLAPPMILSETDLDKAVPAPRPARSAKQWDHEPDEGSAN